MNPSAATLRFAVFQRTGLLTDAIRGLASLSLYLLAGLVLPFYAHGAKGWDVIRGE